LINISIGGVPEHFNLPWHLLLEGRALEARGIAATWRDYPEGTGAMVAALDAGDLDLALLLTEGAVAGAARGARFEILSLYTESPLIWGIHVPAGSRFTGVGELAAARFAISRFGSGSHLMSLALASQQAWPADSLRFVVVGTLEGAVESFRRDEADVFLWERFMTQPVVERGDFRRVGELVAPWPAFVACAATAALEEKRAAIEFALDAVGEEATRLAVADDAATRIAARYGLAEPSVSEWLERTRWAPRRVSPRGAVAAAREMLVRAGVLAA